MALGARTHTGEASKGSPLSPQSASDRQLRTQNFPQPPVMNAISSIKYFPKVSQSHLHPLKRRIKVWYFICPSQFMEFSFKFWKERWPGVLLVEHGWWNFPSQCIRCIASHTRGSFKRWPIVTILLYQVYQTFYEYTFTIYKLCLAIYSTTTATSVWIWVEFEHLNNVQWTCVYIVISSPHHIAPNHTMCFYHYQTMQSTYTVHWTSWKSY